MKYLVLLCALFTIIGCTSSSGSLSPIQQVGCDIETAINASFSQAVASALTCSNPGAIQSSLATAFSAANLCMGQVAAATTAQLSSAKAALKAGVKSDAVKPLGVVGNLACPIAVSSALGFLSNAIPASWGCSATASASALSATLTTLCEAAVPI